LSKVIAGHPDYVVTSGDVRFDGESVLGLEPEERARRGIFLSFQHPVEIPGVSTSVFLKAAVNAIRRSRGQPELDAAAFLRFAREKMALVEMDKDLLHRSLNEGFSGGEKKRNEIMQLAILDETDSGLDIDALRIVAKGIREVRVDRPDMSVVLITHYQRLLDELRPDHIHVLIAGRIVESGGMEIVERLERDGYESFRSMEVPA